MHPRSQLFIALFACCVAAACSDDPGSPTSPTQDAGVADTATFGEAEAPDVPPGCDGLAGNYDILVDLGPYVDADIALTLSLVESEKGCSAIATPAFYPFVEMSLEVTKDALVLFDLSGVTPPSLGVGLYENHCSYQEYWVTRLSIPRMDDGKLASSARFEGESATSSEDWGGAGPMEGTATVMPDATPPSFRLGPRRVLPPTRTDVWMPCSAAFVREGLPPDLMLPWETLTVEASEPLEGLAAHVEVVAEDVDLAPVTEPIADAQNAVNVWALTRFADWDRVRGTTPTVRLLPGLADAAGHAVEPLESPIRILDVGPPTDAHDFDGQQAYGWWGEVVTAEGGITVEGDYLEAAGVAGQLKTVGKSSVWIRLEGRSGVVQVVTASSVSEARIEYSDGVTDMQFAIAPAAVAGFVIRANVIRHLEGGPIFLDRVWAE